MLNEALRLMRVYHDMSQTALCVDLGISNSYLSEIESGKKTPTLELLQKYADRFKVPVSSLMFFSESLDLGATAPLRQTVAKKVISLLKWVESKNVDRRAFE